MKKLLFLIIASSLTWAAEPKVLFEAEPTLLTTSIYVVLLTGPIDDAPNKAGLTNIIAQLMTRGTKKKSRSKFQLEVEKLGASIAARVSQDSIVFEGEVIKEQTLPFIQLIEEFLIEPAFAKKEFESLKREVLNQIRYKKNNTGRLAGLALRKEIFAGTTLELPMDGGISTVSKLTLDDVTKGYQSRFHRGNVIFAVASSVDEKTIKDHLQAMWQKLPEGTHQARKPIPLKVPAKPMLIVVERPHTTTGSMIFGQTGITAQEPLRYALDVGNFSFGGEPLVSRMFKTIRGDLGWTYAINTSYAAAGGLSSQPGLFVISGTPSVEFTAKTILKSLSMWREYYTSGLKREELRTAKESLINSYPFEFDSANKRLARKVHAFLYGVPTLSPAEYTKTITGISNQTIKEAMAKLQTTEGWVIAVAADSAEIKKQLALEQKDVPEIEQIKISKIVKPEDVIN